jgi:uncharacterized protein
VRDRRPAADLCVDSVLDVDFAALASSGVRGVLLDVDNTLVRPGGAHVPRAFVEHLHHAREVHIERWALASNARRDLSPVVDAIGIDTVKAGLLIAKPRRRYYRRALARLGLPPEEVAMIGDKALHDVFPAARMGLRTILVRPAWPDLLVDRILMRRGREARFFDAQSPAGTPPATTLTKFSRWRVVQHSKAPSHQRS